MACHARVTPPPIMPDKERLFDIRTKTVKFKNNATSDKHEKVASRLAPIPSKLDPVSRAAKMIKNLANPNR